MEILKNKLIYFFKVHKQQILFYLFLNVLFVLCITLSSYVHIPLSGYKDRLLYFTHIILNQFSVAGFIYLVTVNKWGFRLIFMPCFIILSLFSYWTYIQDISVTNSLIQIVLETKPSIVMGLLSVQYLLFIFFIVVILIIINKVYNKISPIKWNLPFILLAFLSIYSYSYIENKRINTLKSRLPYNVVFGLKKYFETEKLVLNKVPTQVTYNQDSINIVLVLGESVRADHLQVNGYYRKNMPFLANRSNLVSFNNIYTPHTYTASSLPRIITDASVNDSEINNVTSVFDVLNACNYYTAWIGNQELESSYERIVRTNKKVVLIDSLRSVLSFNKALDEETLQPLKKLYFKNHKKGLYTIHMMGSHWWYENRYTQQFRKYTPVIDSKHVPSLSKNQMINSYDNTIVYLDNFLNEVISIQESLNNASIMIYISDHGEALGEEGKWLHAQEIESIKNPAMLVWYSNKFKEKYPLKVKALINNCERNYSTDILYYSLLDIIGAKNAEFKPLESVFFDSFSD